MKLTEKTYAAALGTVHYWITPPQADRPWLVFLPGLTADHRLFDKQTAYFSDFYNCLTWDAPAHGASRPFALEFSMEDMARYLHGIIQAEGIDAPVLVGQSLGGYLSQVYMELYPDSVSGFVSIDSSSLSRKYFSRWELALLKHTKGMYLAIPWKLLLKWGIAGNSETAYGRELMAKTWADYSRNEFCTLVDYGFRIIAQAVECRPEYTIRCPVLLLCGEKDAAGSIKRYNRRWTKLDGHQLVWLKNAGHNSNTDAPDRVNRLIQEFVQSLAAISANA